MLTFLDVEMTQCGCMFSDTVLSVVCLVWSLQLVDITFILLSRVLKALFRSGVFSDGETACHCRGEFRLSAQPTDNMLGWDGEAGGGEGGRRGMGAKWS